MKNTFIPVGETLANTFAHAGVTHVFGFPGETSLPLYIGMQKTSGIQHVLARCPRCAAYMAESYARVSGKLGICDAPGGIGSPFVTPALHEANNSSTPLLFLASGVDQHKKGRWTTSQCDQQHLFKAVTKATYLLDEAENTGKMLYEAMHTAITPRTGPVFFEIPADIFAAESSAKKLPKFSINYPNYRISPDKKLLDEVVACLHRAKSPVIVAGGGVFLSKAVNEVQTLHATTGIPIATTLNGKGIVDEKNKNVLGVTGSKGSVEVNSYVQQSDCIVVLGSKLGDKSTNQYAWPRPGQTVIHVDADPKELKHLQEGYLPVLADIKVFVSELSELLKDWSIKPIVLPEKKIFWEEGATHQLCQLITDILPEDSILVADASVASGWAGAAVTFSKNQRLVNPRGSGSIGYALPAAIGASFARPDKKIIAIGGDGGFAISMHEMETAARYRLPIIYFLLNNNRLGLIDKHATALLKGKPVSDQFIDVEWCAIAQSMGWAATRIDSPRELKNLIPLLSSIQKPLLIDYRISPNEMAPDFFITLNHTKRASL